MMEDYASIKVGDRVRFWIARDRIRPEKIEYKLGTAVWECVGGWVVRTSTVTMAEHGVNAKNYL